MNNSEGETVLTYTGIQYAILCHTLEICLRMLQKKLLVFKGFIYPLYNGPTASFIDMEKGKFFTLRGLETGPFGYFACSQLLH
jgi:hypothetical protein